MKLQSILLVTATYLFSVNATANQNYTFDKNHSYVQWSVDHFGYSDVTGKIFVTGNIEFNEKNPEQSKLEINVPMNTLSTGISKFDQKLLGRNFFNAEQFPTANFAVKSIQKTGNDSGTIKGIVTISGISKPLDLQVQLRKFEKHPFFKRPALGFLATASLNRSDFGLRAYIPGVSDKVDLTIQIEAIQDRAEDN